MDRRIVLVVPLALLLIACMTCNTTTSLPATSLPALATDVVKEATSEPATAPADIRLYSDDNGDEGSEITSFQSSQRKLHFGTDVDPLKKGQKVKWLFFAVDAGNMNNEQIGELNMDIPLDGVNNLTAALSNDQDWPTGTYRVELYIDGDLIKSAEFKIE